MEQEKPSNLVGGTIRKLRVGRQWTQEILTARCNLAGCDISRGTLAKIEAEIRGINDRELITIAYVFGVEVEALFSDGFVARLKKQIARKGLPGE